MPLRKPAPDHGAFSHNSNHLNYTTLKVNFEADITLIERVQETLKTVPTDDIRKFAARNIYSRSTTTLTNIPIEEQDDTITALPPPPAQSIRRKTKTQDLATSSLRLESSNDQQEIMPYQTLQRSQSLDDSALGNRKNKKGSVWRRLIKAIKKPFRTEKEQPQPKGLSIGGPTEFKHVQTGTACLSGPPRSANNDAEGEAEDWETTRASESFYA